jgi:hypothetical protein
LIRKDLQLGENQVRRGDRGSEGGDEYTAVQNSARNSARDSAAHSTASTDPTMSNVSVVLHGAASPLGEQLLLKLALAGFEVTAQVPPAPWQGQTGEYAAHLTDGPVSDAVAASPGERVIVVAAGPMARDEVEASIAHAGRLERWVQCATREADLAELVAPLHAARIPVTTVLHATVHGDLRMAAGQLLRRRTPLAVWRAQWAGPIPAADEASVAALAVKAMTRQRAAVLVPGAPLAITDILCATSSAESLRPWWLPLIGGRRRTMSAVRFRSSKLPSSTTT